MDVIARTAFGIEVDTQKNPNSPFVSYAKKLFAINMARPAILLYCKYKFRLKLNVQNQCYISILFLYALL